MKATDHLNTCRFLDTNNLEDNCPRCQEIIAIRTAQGQMVVSTWSAAELMAKVNASRNAYQVVIDGKRAQGVSDIDICDFIDKGKADKAADKIIKRSKKDKTK